MSVLILAGYLSSLFMGLVLGAIGGGGSILTVPILIYLFGMTAWSSTAHSLVVVGITAFAGAILAYQRKDIDLVKVWIFGLPGIVGVFVVRAWLMPALPVYVTLGSYSFERGSLVLTVFVALMLATSLGMIFSSSKQKETSSVAKDKNVAKNKKKSPAILLLLFEGLLVGVVTGFVGAGGGFLIVPALVKFAKLPMKLAIGTSLGIIALKSLVGILGEFANLLTLDWPLLGIVSILAIFGMWIGTFIREKIRADLLKKSFGYFVLLMALLIAWQEF